MEITLINPRGFCAGVARAIAIVEEALKRWGAPIYVRHEIVHNHHVLARLKAQGVIFVENEAVVPTGAILILSAHGVSKQVEENAVYLGLKVIDATCPLVKKVHKEVLEHAKSRRSVVVIGHREHPEIQGVLGRYDAQDSHYQICVISKKSEVEQLPFSNDEPLAFVTQTTLSVHDTAEIIEALQQRYPQIIAPHKGDICYATTNRQAAVLRLAKRVSLMLVIGSKNSSNTNQLVYVAQQAGCSAYLISEVEEILLLQNTLKTCQSVGITAGASAPEWLVQQVIAYLKAHYDITLIHEAIGEQEKICFSLPKIFK